MTGHIDFWFDFASSYSYLAAMRVDPLAPAPSIKVNWRPFLLGPVFTAMGWNDSPLQHLSVQGSLHVARHGRLNVEGRIDIYPSKGRYMWRDMERLCKYYGVPLKRPSKFPRNGLRPARIICAHQDAPWVPDFVRAVFTAGFAGDQDIGEREVIADLLRS